jgi:hypothetical protein
MFTIKSHIDMLIINLCIPFSMFSISDHIELYTSRVKDKGLDNLSVPSEEDFMDTKSKRKNFCLCKIFKFQF